MLDLILALFLLALPRIWATLSVPGATLGAIATAAILIWPGYILVRWLWSDRGLGLLQRLAYIQLFGTLAMLSTSLLLWIVLHQATPEAVNLLLLVGLTAIVLKVLASPHVTPLGFAHREFWATCAVFAVLAIGLWLPAGAFKSSADTTRFSLHLAAQSAPVNQPASDMMVVRVQAANESTAARITLVMTAEVSGQIFADRTFELAPGERRDIALEVPRAALSPSGETPIDIRLQLTNAPDSARTLRVWLSPAG